MIICTAQPILPPSPLQNHLPHSSSASQTLARPQFNLHFTIQWLKPPAISSVRRVSTRSSRLHRSENGTIHRRSISRSHGFQLQSRRQSPAQGPHREMSPTFLSTVRTWISSSALSQTHRRKRCHPLLSAAWDDDPLTALKLVLHLRGVRGTGKSDREGFIPPPSGSMLTIPKPLLSNLPSMADFGYLKDLLRSSTA
ncbi:hypothetical protein KSP40_PGU014781 [Platanthera guangdongensis]|uniref:DUF2828 domain-containing protein n=1 Tax=Platanthera guangdongensis TaxID=2320717 RepID=A0ABR2MNJ6_9ASPA